MEVRINASQVLNTTRTSVRGQVTYSRLNQICIKRTQYARLKRRTFIVSSNRAISTKAKTY